MSVRYPPSSSSSSFSQSFEDLNYFTKYSDTKTQNMGIRFHNLKSLYRTSISKLSHTNTHKNKKFHPNPIIFQTLNSHLRTLSDSENHKYNHPVYKIPKRWHLGHSHHGHDQKEQSQQYGKEGENIFRLGLAADIGLAAGKAFTGYLSGSTAIIADAAHSVSDVVNFKV